MNRGIMHPSARDIALGLQGERAGTNKYTARCPAHNDRSPSLSLTQASDKVLVYCHAGCSQEEVIHSLQDLGLWPKFKPQLNRSPSNPKLASGDIDYIGSYVLIYRKEVSIGYQPSEAEKQQHNRFSALLRNEGMVL